MPHVKDVLGRGRVTRISRIGPVEFDHRSIAWNVSQEHAEALLALPHFVLHDGIEEPEMATSTTAGVPAPGAVISSDESPPSPPPPATAPRGKSLGQVIAGIQTADLHRAVGLIPTAPPPLPSLATTKLEVMRRSDLDALLVSCDDASLLKKLLAQETGGKNRKSWLAAITARLEDITRKGENK